MISRAKDHRGKRFRLSNRVVPSQALKANLLRLQNEWEAYQSNHERDAVYGYLAAVFELVEWWDQEGKAGSRASRALLQIGQR